ncbi:hypothetical protein Ct61P_06403 [Colletotrichum tofieldiae]|nr:hypothetical protein Ct61P_06403 [Colletotrichum tofieldiae]
MTRSAKDVLEDVMAIFFKNHKWHKAAVELGANPIFFGSDLKRLALGENCQELHLAAVSMDFTGDIQYEAKLAVSLKHPQFDDDGVLSRVHGANSRFTLNIQEDNDCSDDDGTMVDDFGSLFSQESDKLTTWVLYYNKGQGHLEEFHIPGHQLPWRRRYRIPLQYSFSAYNSKPLEWVVAQGVGATFKGQD